MPETLVIMERSISFHLRDSVLLGLTWSLLAAVSAVLLWKRQRTILAAALAVVCVAIAIPTVRVSAAFYRDWRPSESATVTLTNEQVTIRRSYNDELLSFRPGEVKALSQVTGEPGRSVQLLLFTPDGTGHHLYAAADQAPQLTQALARLLQLQQTDPDKPYWFYPTTGN